MLLDCCKCVLWHVLTNMKRVNSLCFAPEPALENEVEEDLLCSGSEARWRSSATNAALQANTGTSSGRNSNEF